MSTTRPRVGVGTDPRRIARLALALPLILAVAACGGATGSSGGSATASIAASASPAGSGVVAGATGSPAASVAASPTAEDACSLVTTDEATQLVGTAVMPAATSTPLGPTCRFTPSEAGKLGFLTTEVFTGDVQKTLSDAITNFGLTEVPGVGTSAAGVDGTIYVSTGTTAFAIVAADGTFKPVPLAQLTTLASSVVERLGGTNAAPSASPSASDAGGSASPSPSAS